MKILPTLLISIFTTYGGQQENLWNVLAQVSFTSTRDNKGYEIEKPVFSNYLKSFNGKKITLKGYLIPMGEVGRQTFMLSRLPFNVCYFCGAAGPDTVVEMETSSKLKFTSKPIVVEGTLLLNNSDPDRHLYILKSALLIQ